MGATASTAITASAAAQLKQVSRQAVVEAAKTGRIRGVRDGRVWRVDRASVEAWQPRRPPTRPPAETPDGTDAAPSPDPQVAWLREQAHRQAEMIATLRETNQTLQAQLQAALAACDPFG